ncbi:MAG: 5'-3' exonuclease H3TH domain-containing protein [Opitutaceae bacterium]|nr:5'-3' exonuclease H3TH domain-containing protein [Opitutaceae bacterium]
MGKWLLVDGFNLAYRCYFAVPELTRADGFPTNAVHGWVKSLWKLADQEKPAATLVFFDLGGAQDRLALLPEYKAQREEMPAELVKQLPYIKAVTRAMGLVGVEKAGVESDDLLASQAVQLAAQGHAAVIVSADKDFAQIVGERIVILLPPPSANPKLGWRRLDTAGVVEKFGVPPAQIPDYLALVGDSSDNIPGIEGVGPKTAARWLQQFGSLAGVVDHARQLKPERFQESVSALADLVRRNLKLTTLNLSLPTVAAEKPAADPVELFRLLEELEMKSTLAEARQRYAQTEMF